MTERKGQFSAEMRALAERFDFLARARANSYAAGADGKTTRTLPGGFEFRYTEKSLLYRDVYRPGGKGLGGFAGLETVDEIVRGERTRVLTYSYGGGLTLSGVYHGETHLYKILRQFLKEYSNQVRLGLNVEFDLTRDDGLWRYIGKGNRGAFPWGWFDEERITRNRKTLYTLHGTFVLDRPHIW